MGDIVGLSHIYSSYMHVRGAAEKSSKIRASQENCLYLALVSPDLTLTYVRLLFGPAVRIRAAGSSGESASE